MDKETEYRIVMAQISSLQETISRLECGEPALGLHGGECDEVLHDLYYHLNGEWLKLDSLIE